MNHSFEFILFLLSYFLACTFVFIRLIRSEMENNDSINLADIAINLFAAFFPVLNIQPTIWAFARVIDSLEEFFNRFSRITVWRKKCK